MVSQTALVVKNPPASVGDIRDVVPSLGREDPLEEGRATHSRIPACEPQGQRRLRATVHRVAARCDVARMRGGWGHDLGEADPVWVTSRQLTLVTDRWCCSCLGAQLLCQLEGLQVASPAQRSLRRQTQLTWPHTVPTENTPEELGRNSLFWPSSKSCRVTFTTVP